MKRPLLNKAFAVGLLAAVCGVAFLLAFTFLRKGGYSEKDTYTVFTFYEDATGLTWKSRVQIAGIQVGEVERITLSSGRARLDIRVKNEVDIRADACFVKRYPSTLLPDALLDLAPGTARAISLRALPPEEREVRCAQEAASIAKLLDSMSKIAVDVQGVTRELNELVAGSQGSIRQIVKNLEQVSQRINESVTEGQGKISAILDNTESFTGTLADVADRDRERYHAIARNIEAASKRLDQVLQSVQQIVGGPDEEGTRKTISDARQAIQRLNNTLEQVEKTARNIGEGKGVAGKLLNDERLGEKFGNTVEQVSDYVDRLAKLQVQVNLRSEWLVKESGAKTYAGFALIPRPDRYYLFEVVSDPRGYVTQTVEQIATSDATTPTTVTRRTTEQKVSFSLEFAKRYGPMTFRIGLIESSGGAGADLHLLDDKLKVSLNLYQFSRPERPDYPRAKLWVDYMFLKYLYATVGTDDFLNKWSAGRYPFGPNFSMGQDVFIGGGVVFTDDDLKTLLGAGAGSVTSTAASSAH